MLEGRIQVPGSVRKGEAFEIRVLVRHPMETGFRRDMNGREVPVHILERLACTYGGREVFRAELGTGISANPYFAFHAVAESSGEVVVEFSDSRGERGRVATLVSVA